MLIQNHEVRDWFSEEPRSLKKVFQAYEETISDILPNLLIDPRASVNSYIVNQDFRNTPKYLAAFNANAQTRLFVLSVLYVYPEFRKQGYGNHLIQQVQNMVGSSGVVQVAVEENDVSRLHDFYIKHSFKTTGELIPNQFGKKYCDYFWSGRAIEINKTPDGQFAITPT
ncbi:GNAT family N-acetyltransferase [Vibrio panuliri]|nr:GNAT family N-acetyltransferase [Vibrio panuliri]